MGQTPAELVREIINRARAIERFVLAHEEIMGPRSLELIKDVDLEGLRKYVKKKYEQRQDYFPLSVKELRSLARKRNIPDYQSADKITLVLLLESNDDTREIEPDIPSDVCIRRRPGPEENEETETVT